MKIKAILIFKSNPISGYNKEFKNYNEIPEVNLSLGLKVKSKKIDIPFLPTKEVIIDILPFNEVYKFSNKEIKWLLDFNNLFEITEIIMSNDTVNLWLEPIKNEFKGQN